MVLERAVSYGLDVYDFESVMKAAVMDRLLPGRGQAWVRYVPTFGPAQEDPAGGEPFKPVTYEEVRCDYVFWRDFLHSPARNWQEVWWVAKRAYMSESEMTERFGAEVAKKVPRTHKPDSVSDDGATKTSEANKAVVWEIWHKPKKEVVWIADGYGELLDKQPPLVNLRDFWPCPKPLYATTTTDSLIPVPDYAEYQGQADEIDEMTLRISVLVKGLKLVGVYDASAKGLERMLTEGVENELIPVESWAAFKEKGGMTGAVEWMPIKEVAEVLLALYQAREAAKKDLYEITGISDIVRGQGDASETATAQRIKGKFATLRLDDMQKDVARFARDLVRIKAEIIAETFSPETLSAMTGLPAMPEQPEMPQDPMQAQQVMAGYQAKVQKAQGEFQAAVELLRNDAMRSFRVDIETDSTVEPDEQAEKEARVEMLESMGVFMEKAVLIGQQAPQMMPVLGEMMLFALRGFKAGRTLEATFEEAMETIREQANQPPPPDPQIAIEEKKLELKARESQQSMALKQQESQQGMALRREEMGAELMMQREKSGAEMQIRAAEAAGMMKLKEQEQAIRAAQPREAE